MRGGSVMRLVVLAVALAAGCYRHHRRPIEPEDLGDGEGSPTLASCEPRFETPLLLHPGRTFDDVDLGLVWTGSAFLVSFDEESATQWGTRIGPDGEVVALGGADYVGRMAVLPGTPYVALGGSWGLRLVDAEGGVVGGPYLAGPDEHDWQWTMQPYARPAGLGVVSSLRGWRDTPEPPSPEGLFAFSSPTPEALPERMPISRLDPAGDSWLVERADGPDGYARFLAAQLGERLLVVEPDDDGTPVVSATWSAPGGLDAAVASAAGDYALFVVGRHAPGRGLVWHDVRTGARMPLAPLGALSRTWNDAVPMGDRVLVAAAFAGDPPLEHPPLVLRSYAPGGDVSDAELVLDPEPRAREVALVRHPCGVAAAWRPDDASVRFQAYDCCP